ESHISLYVWPPLSSVICTWAARKFNNRILHRTKESYCTKRRNRMKIVICLLALFSTMLFAQDRILVAASSVSGTYELMTQDISRSEEHTSELQLPCNLVCRLVLEKKKLTAL